MPLLDHFRPPLEGRRSWHAFHNAWATCLAWELNAQLPPGYFAEPHVQFGIEIDVAALDDRVAPGDPSAEGWTPPAPSATIPLVIVTDSVEVSIFATEEGPILAGAIELISPANKDRPANRDAFTSKCAAYLQAGVGLVVVDIVTSRGGDLHAELMTRLYAPDAGSSTDLYAAAYRPIGREGEGHLDIWRESIALGGPMPTLPICLKAGPCLPVDLEATYERTRRERPMVLDPSRALSLQGWWAAVGRLTTRPIRRAGNARIRCREIDRDSRTRSNRWIA
jgi:hypothetical protein